MKASSLLCVLFAFLFRAINIFAQNNDAKSSEKSTCEIYRDVKLMSANNTRYSYTSSSSKKSGPAPFRLAILAMLVSDFVTDNFAEIGTGFQEFDVIKFYEEILKHGGTRGLNNYKDCCFNSCFSGLIPYDSDHHLANSDSISDKIGRTTLCEALCDHTMHFLKSMDYFFLSSSELFELKITEKESNHFLEKDRNFLKGQSQAKKQQKSSLIRENEEKDDMAKVQSFSSVNKFLLDIQDREQNQSESSDSNSIGSNHHYQLHNHHEEDPNNIKDASVMNFIEDKDFETEEMININSRLLMLWDVDKTLWDSYNFIQKGVIYGRAGKFNPYTMSLLFMIKERQQHDPRILDQYIITYGRGTLMKLQSPFLKSLCYSCWDLMRVYDRYFAEKYDSIQTQDFKRVFEAKEHNTISFNGEEFKFRNCPGTLKNLLFWKGKDMELIRDHIVSADESLRKEYYYGNISNNLTDLEIEYNFRYPFKTRSKSKIDEIVTVLIDDTVSHLKLTCIEEYHLFNMVVIPIIPFKGINIDERIEMEFRKSGTSHLNLLTNDLIENDLSPIRGVNSIHIPGILNDALNQVPLNANATELSRAIRKKISEISPGRFPESQCNYDLINTKAIYLTFLSSCKFFNDIITLFNNLPESHPSYADIHYLLSNIDSWGFDESHNTKMCSIVNDRINSYMELCDKTSKAGKLRESNKNNKSLITKRICSIEWKNRFFFGFALREHYGPIPLNALSSSLLPRRRTIILNIEADHIFNSVPLSMYENRFFYCTIKTNLFSSTFETIRKITIATRSTLKYVGNISSNNLNEIDRSDLRNVLEVARNSTKVFQSHLSNLFEKLDNGGSTNNKLHYKIYKEYTNCILID
ncbi:unnamed protein product [Cryptosporidium hominis]|uniref:FCP1 homology domain-containing protein n=2 Tax=Cryptosporidium hominis TaxID=237895 RepID=A0A0S4TEX1_CRYHO|nr:Uncharacterized protein GY17_00003864 [Cryptosporidium hominis]CUV04898.1 unnamed protein product [Cryptosporidium hominis]|eukprot:PPS92968.1 Uncharacterized protein GY17_00003864 [Cryptosporidium hominis]